MMAVGCQNLCRCAKQCLCQGPCRAAKVALGLNRVFSFAMVLPCCWLTPTLFCWVQVYRENPPKCDEPCTCSAAWCP